MPAKSDDTGGLDYTGLSLPDHAEYLQIMVAGKIEVSVVSHHVAARGSTSPTQLT
jgi:hypothetical protein